MCIIIGEMYTLPFNNLEKLDFSKGYMKKDTGLFISLFLRGWREAGDTFLDFGGWGKRLCLPQMDSIWDGFGNRAAEAPVYSCHLKKAGMKFYLKQMERRLLRSA